MPEYIRNFVKGGTYFFTLVTYHRMKVFTDELYSQAFLTPLEKVQTYHLFILIAFCVLPDHVHLLLSLSEEDSDFSSRIKEIKKKTTLAIRNLTGTSDFCVWQDRFWEHTIRDENDFLRHFDYIHYNPIKHGYSDTLDWRWSSYRRYYELDRDAFRSINPNNFLDGKYSYGE